GRHRRSGDVPSDLDRVEAIKELALFIANADLEERWYHARAAEPVCAGIDGTLQRRCPGRIGIAGAGRMDGSGLHWNTTNLLGEATATVHEVLELELAVVGRIRRIDVQQVDGRDQAHVDVRRGGRDARGIGTEHRRARCLDIALRLDAARDAGRNRI